MTYTPILGSLGFVMSADRKRVLLVHRTARPEDDQLGKYNGLGGKMEPAEDVVSCMRRELREEAGIEGVSMVLRGTVNWTNFGTKGEDWLGFIFRIDEFSGELLRQNAEGTLDWHRIDELERLDMWEGDRHFLPLVFDDDPRMFHGYMPYDRERPLSWSFERL
ncbi:MAG TPA: 8-oxo-dGTP diphosphatase [Candidatus Krumholzibacteria bacterium]|jgi:8-oxo-dGTP diphosphatase